MKLYPHKLRVFSMAALIFASFAMCTLTQPIRTDGKLKVITTVSPLTSITENIGGNRIVLLGIVPDGVNSHNYQPSPSVIKHIESADLIILNGLFLEDTIIKIIETTSDANRSILYLGDMALRKQDWIFDFSFPETKGVPNPHLWLDPLMALNYADLVRNELVKLDPSEAAYYNDNFTKLRTRIEDLDRRILYGIASIPQKNRMLFTYHDSWPYFARRYGMEILGAVQPSDLTEPSAREMAELIELIKRADVPAVFGSQVFPSPVMEQIAKESGITFVDDLSDDDLPGLAGDDEHSYLGLMVKNLTIMVDALGGDSRYFESLDVSPVFLGRSEAEYPQ
jgi:ABC-type Zn uptake system ZnuABC Zn-binding protein ZnuA